MKARRKITVADLQRSVNRTQRVLSTEEFKARVAAIKRDVVDLMRVGGHERLADAVGRDAAAWTAETWPR